MTPQTVTVSLRSITRKVCRCLVSGAGVWSLAQSNFEEVVPTLKQLAKFTSSSAAARWGGCAKAVQSISTASRASAIAVALCTTAP